MTAENKSPEKVVVVPTSKDDGVWQPPPTTLPLYLQPGQELKLLDLDKHIAYNQGVILTQLRIEVNDDHWRVIVKGMKGRQPVVAFLYAKPFSHCLSTFAEMAWEGSLKWQPDKYRN